jgi:peptide/nickel transport system permease protein
VHAIYIVKRFGVFLLIVWLAATLNFFLPKLSGQDPVRTKLLEEASLGGYVHAGIESMVEEYQKRFGLDKPLWRQYLTYLSDVSRGDLNYSIANYPRTVAGMIREALPWTIGLLGVTTIFSFAAGTILGALLAWPRAPRWMRLLMPPLWALHAIPFFLLGLVLSWLLAFKFQWLPIFGGYSAGANPAWNWTFILDVLRHATLPALSIVLVSVGGWALTMRGMMVTTMGEDYVTFAEAKGLRSATIFTRYCMRNAILPQTTGLALALGQILSGAVLVEAIFGYPGIGALLF